MGIEYVLAPKPGPECEDSCTEQIALYAFANTLCRVRQAWIEADVERKSWILAGLGEHGGGYEKIVGEHVFATVRRLWRVIQDDVRFVLPHSDSSLRDRIVRVVSLCDPSSFQLDLYGENTRRWRQQWEATGLEIEFDSLVTILTAAGDKAVQQIRPTTEDIPAEMERPPVPKATQADKRRERLVKAMLLTNDHPEWSMAEIARQVGVHRSTLSRSSQFKKAYKLAAMRNIRSGSMVVKDNIGTLEAVDDEFDPNRDMSRQSNEESDRDERLDAEINMRNAARNKGKSRKAP